MPLTRGYEWERAASLGNKGKERKGSVAFGPGAVVSRPERPPPPLENALARSLKFTKCLLGHPLFSQSYSSDRPILSISWLVATTMERIPNTPNTERANPKPTHSV